MIQPSIQPGLQRISRLVKDVPFPWKAIHVAGTNGKGSICAYASALLTRRIIPNGRFVSPHLVNRWDSITTNDKPVSEDLFRKVESHFIGLNEREDIQASSFEILTATAFEIFNQQKVQVGVVEVGMGGTFDATNILNNQAVSVISAIALDHNDFLGSTLDEIARHKAGILRPNVPYMVNPTNEPNVKQVIDEYAEEIGAGPCIRPDDLKFTDGLFKSKEWHAFSRSLHPVQRENGALGYLAFLEALESINESTKNARRLLPHIKRKRLVGRFHNFKVPAVFGSASTREIRVDGAHDESAARALRSFMDRKSLKQYKEIQPTVWVVAMSKGKDARSFLSTLLADGDAIITTRFGPVDGMPWVKPMDPEELLQIAHSTNRDIMGIHIPERGVLRAICTANHLVSDARIVVTGSLYLVGDFMREKELYAANPKSLHMGSIDSQERLRVRQFNLNRLSKAGRAEDSSREGLFSASARSHAATKSPTNPEIERRKLSDEIKSIDHELSALEREEQRLLREHRLGIEQPGSDAEHMLPAPIPIFDNQATKRNRINLTSNPKDEPSGSEGSRVDATAPENISHSQPRIRTHYVDEGKKNPLYHVVKMPNHQDLINTILNSGNQCLQMVWIVFLLSCTFAGGVMDSKNLGIYMAR